jgi:hypothetical protein
MDIPTELSGILSEFGLPVGAGALAYGLVRGANALEEDAKEERLNYISDLLKDRSFTSYGKLSASIVPFVFTKIFGSNPFSFKFISRSVLASMVFWLILLEIKHVPLSKVIDLLNDGKWSILPYILLIDWISLVKSKLILGAMSKLIMIGWVISFVIVDTLLTILILLGVFIAYAAVTMYFMPTNYHFHSLSDGIKVMFDDILLALTGYFTTTDIHALAQVAIPSTMLTSAWVLLFLISTILAKLLGQLEYIRRFTLWWFKDIDAHPL